MSHDIQGFRNAREGRKITAHFDEFAITGEIQETRTKGATPRPREVYLPHGLELSRNGVLTTKYGTDGPTANKITFSGVPDNHSVRATTAEGLTVSAEVTNADTSESDDVHTFADGFVSIGKLHWLTIDEPAVCISQLLTEPATVRVTETRTLPHQRPTP